MVGVVAGVVEAPSLVLLVLSLRFSIKIRDR